MGLRTTGPETGRNELCPCGSKLKFIQCHGDESKRVIANRVATLKMVELILVEQKKRGIMPWKYKCHDCEHGFDTPKESTVQGLDGACFLCPKCGSSYLIEEKDEQNEKETG